MKAYRRELLELLEGIQYELVRSRQEATKFHHEFLDKLTQLIVAAPTSGRG